MSDTTTPADPTPAERRTLAAADAATADAYYADREAALARSADLIRSRIPWALVDAALRGAP